MLSLDEMIKHYEKVAEDQEWMANHYDDDSMGKEMCLECAKEHRQIAEWLKELKQRRNYENGCQYCKYKFRSDEDEPCIICSHNYTDKFKDDGTREANTDDT